jgi:O-antigen/teichoic acid export membrane protein
LALDDTGRARYGHASWDDDGGAQRGARRPAFAGGKIAACDIDDHRPITRTVMLALHRLKLIAGSLLGKQSSDLRTKRLVGMIQGVTTSIGNKMLGFVITFVSVPLTIHYLGAERFGAWVVIGSALAWLGLTDFGLGHGLTNAVTTAASQERTDLVRMHLSNFMLLMVLVALGIAPILFLAATHLDLANLFGVHTPLAIHELNVAVLLSIGFFLLRMPISLSGRVYNAYQEGRIANYWGAAGNIANLVCLVAVTRTGGGLPMLVLAMNGAGLLIELGNTVWLFTKHRPAVRPGFRYVNRAEMHAISKVGVQFFIITAMALVTFQTDTLIIAHFLGSEAVPRYSVAYALFNYATLPQAMMFPYLWAAYNEAITRGDMAWVRKTFRLNVTLGVVATSLVAGFMLLICRPFILWWAGPLAVPTLPLATTMVAWVIINAFTNPIACLLAAASHLRNQIRYSALATVSNLLLSLYFVTKFGPTGVIGSTVISYLVFVAGRLMSRLEQKRA